MGGQKKNPKKRAPSFHRRPSSNHDKQSAPYFSVLRRQRRQVEGTFRSHHTCVRFKYKRSTPRASHGPISSVNEKSRRNPTYAREGSVVSSPANTSSLPPRPSQKENKHMEIMTIAQHPSTTHRNILHYDRLNPGVPRQPVPHGKHFPSQALVPAKSGEVATTAAVVGVMLPLLRRNA